MNKYVKYINTTEIIYSSENVENIVVIISKYEFHIMLDREEEFINEHFANVNESNNYSYE